MRDDYRVSLEGMSKKYEADSAEEFDDFTELFKHVDDFETIEEFISGLAERYKIAEFAFDRWNATI